MEQCWKHLQNLITQQQQAFRLSFREGLNSIFPEVKRGWKVE
jgi:hypothetical protein